MKPPAQLNLLIMQPILQHPHVPSPSSVGTGSISKAPVVVLLILAVQGGWCGLGRLAEMAFPLDTHPNTVTYFGNISETQIPAGSDRSA